MKKLIVFLQILKTTSFICTGGHFNTFMEVPCVHFHLKRTDKKQHLTHILNIDTSSNDMNEKVDRCLDSFENFHKKYIIIPSESLNYSFLEESFFITVQLPPGFIIQ